MSNKKVCLITGSNSGIGKVAAIEIAKQGYEIIMVARDSQKSQDALLEIQELSQNKDIKLYPCDMSSQKSIYEMSEKIKNDYEKIDVLINNAGVIKRECELSVDGYEMTYAVNYLGVFMLTNALLPLLKNAPKARIINLSSELYKSGKASLENLDCPKKFNGNKIYSDTKLLVLMFTKELTNRLKDTNITVNALHPGVIGTDVFREYPKFVSTILNWFISTPQEGAKPTIYLATSQEVEGISGEYFNKTKRADTIPITKDSNMLKTLWLQTEKLIKDFS